MTTWPQLTHDCSACAALCCLALAFDRGDMFAIDKPAGLPCPNLGPGGACSIHDDLTAKGFAGCVSYGCQGAGQRVTQELFGGQSWQDQPKLAQPMIEAFRALRQVHDLLAMLRAAEALPLNDAQAARHRDLIAALIPTEGWSTAALDAFLTGPLPAQAQAFFTSLRDIARQK